MLTYRTAGESHGKYLVTTVEGLPAGLALRGDFADEILARRRNCIGRSSRMVIESDPVEIISGVLNGRTTGAPLTVLIANRDDRSGEKLPPINVPRPGHVDFAAMAKYLTDDARPAAERASARETAARCVAGAIAQSLLRHFGIATAGYVVKIGRKSLGKNLPSLDAVIEMRNKSRAYSLAPESDAAIERLIKSAEKAGDSLGGVVEVRCEGVPPGIGSVMQWDARLDGRLAAAIMAIPSVKGVEIGEGFALALAKGSEAHDPILPGGRRSTNHAGGIEGGISNGQPIVVRAAVKPIPTLRNALPSVNAKTGKKAPATVERADVCAVPAVSVIAEEVVTFEIARAMCEKFGGDTLKEMTGNYKSYLRALKKTQATTPRYDAISRRIERS